jgi:hypothetical protein
VVYETSDALFEIEATGIVKKTSQFTSQWTLLNICLLPLIQL